MRTPCQTFANRLPLRPGAALLLLFMGHGQNLLPARFPAPACPLLVNSRVLIREQLVERLIARSQAHLYRAAARRRAESADGPYFFPGHHG